ncbi:MAG: trehalose-phosphatase [Gammaproteobacteria bacterium]
MTLRGSFIPARIALFFDVDGTLLEIAPTPHAVKVPAALRNSLQLAAERENGALALISGRAISELDRLFVPCVFPAAGQHGLERRDAQGRITRPHIPVELLGPARMALLRLQAQHKGLLLEDKGAALAMHYRLAPAKESSVSDALRALAAPLAGQFEVRAGKFVFELVPCGYTKRTAIEAFMREEPFAGRTPVFFGDDLADEDGFDAVNMLGGFSIRVGATEETRARYRFGSVSGVIAWLRERNLSY